MSDQAPVSSGVPWGSVLGSILFLAYVNDLPQYVKSKVCLFADDTVIYLARHQVHGWLHPVTTKSPQSGKVGIGLEDFTSKCNVLHIIRKCHPYVHVYKLKGQVLDPVRSVKYLSVDLRWNDDIKTLSNKANKTLGFLKRNLILCPPNTKETAYKALVRPNSAILFICVGFTNSCDVTESFSAFERL